MASIYDKASLVLIPSGTKTSKVYSQKPTNGDGDFTFSRSTAATRVNASGNIEKETQNLLLQSNQFDTTWSLINTSLTSGQAGYDGSNDAWLLDIIGGTNSQRVSQTISKSGVKTFSIYLKAGTLNWVAIRIIDGATNPQVFYDLQNGVLGSNSAVSASIESVGGGWYRCSSVTITAITDVRVQPATGNNNVSQTSGNIYIQDAQLEQGLVARDYIETTTTAIYGGITDNVPRLDYQGSCPALLLEPQRTNLVSQSEYMQYSNNVNVSITDNDATSPEGLDNAAKAVPTTTNSNHIVRSNNLAGLTSQGTYSVSVFAKQNGYKYINVGAGFGSTATPLPTFDLNTGTIVANSSNGTIEDYGDGWYKCTAIIQIASTALYPIIGILNNSQSGSYAGDGTSAVYLYGHQIEEGSYATSYIPTYGSAVTRNNDSCYLLNATSIIGQSEGSVFVEIGEKTTESIGLFEMGQGSSQHRFFLYTDANNKLKVLVVDNYSVQVSYTSSVNISSGAKIAITYANNDYGIYLNGSLLHTDTSASVPPMNQLAIGADRGRVVGATANINEVLLFSTKLSNQEAIDLTTI